MDYRFLKIENPEQGICIMNISQPQSLNSLSRPVLEEIGHFVENLPEGTAVLVVRGDGPKSFVAGADISQMADFGAAEGLEFGRLGADVFRRIEELIHTCDSRCQRLCAWRWLRACHGLRYPHCLGKGQIRPARGETGHHSGIFRNPTGFRNW